MVCMMTLSSSVLHSGLRVLCGDELLRDLLDALLSMDETCTVCCRIVASDDGDLLFNPLRGVDWCGMVWFLWKLRVGGEGQLFEHGGRKKRRNCILC